MTEKQCFEDSEQVMNNGDGHFQDRAALSVNGKRCLLPQDTDVSCSKRSKTLTVENGVGGLPVSPMQSNNTSTLQNGFGDSRYDSKAETAGNADTAANIVKVSTVTTEPYDTAISSQPQLIHPSSTDNASGHNNHVTEDEKLRTEEVTARSEDINAIKDVKQDSQGGGEPEIITLSDSEDEFQEVLTQAMCRNSSNLKIGQLLKLYQDQLRAEESKLILLRKLKQSVTCTDKLSLGVTSDTASKVGSDVRNGNVISQRGSSNGGNVPPPLKRSQHHTQQALSTGSQLHPQHKVTHQHQAAADRSKHTGSSHSTNSHSTNSAGPPPLVNMAKSSGSSAHGTNGSSSSYSNYQSTSASQPKKSAPAPPPKLTAEQTLAAAKIALRKQLEQALLQVPTPKPPPPEVNFLPSLASGEFIYLIGMEEVVKQLLSTDQKDVKFMFNPFSCVQCDADFTPVWKRDKPGSKNVICERCITSNHKQVLKQEHTSKLKVAFSKALQKEQDIERRVAAGSPLSDMPGLAATVVRHQQQASASAAAAAAAAPSMPQLTAQHSQSSPSPNSQQLSTNQLHQQALLQVQAEQMRAMLAAQMLPYQLYSGGVTNKQAADLHRQYLLDMINQNRSSSWKT